MFRENMEIVFFGTANAFTTSANNFHSNALIRSHGGHSLLIDCGADIRRSAHRLGYGEKDFEHVFITHAHCDHMGGLEWLGFTRYFSRMPRPKLYVNPILLSQIEQMLAPSMFCLDGKQADLSTFFELKPTEAAFSHLGTEFQLISVEHTYHHKQANPSHGLFFHSPGHRVFYTGDCRLNVELMMAKYEEATLIFQDCETTPLPSGVHAHYDQLLALPAAIKNKMYLYHYHEPLKLDAEAAGFLGFVRPGQVIQL